MTLAKIETAPIEQAHPLAQIIEMALAGVSVSSARIYQQTYNLWRIWCAENQVDSLDLRPMNVLAFLSSQDVTKATRQRQLSALRKIAAWLSLTLSTEDARRVVEGLKLIRVPTGEGNGKQRTRHALQPREADKVLRVWEQPTNTHRRNQALIAVLALAALRRSEAAALRWRDVDFENGVITVQHGKGDKLRDVPLAGEFALEALQAWHQCQPGGREYVFCPMERGDHIGKDKPLDGTDVYRIVKATETASGVKFKPHDLRRTFITEALATGTPLATVQAAVGHTRGETTLRYAQAVEAREARKTLKLRYG